PTSREQAPSCRKLGRANIRARRMLYTRGPCRVGEDAPSGRFSRRLAVHHDPGAFHWKERTHKLELESTAVAGRGISREAGAQNPAGFGAYGNRPWPGCVSRSV